MCKGSLGLIVLFCVLAVAVAVGIFAYMGGLNSNISQLPTPIAMPAQTAMPTATMPPPTPASNLTATSISRPTVTYSELSRNQTMIEIQFKFEPNSYIFQINATSFYLTDDGTRVSANINDVVVIGTQYSTLYFPINGYNGTGYRLSSDALPPDTVWIKR